MTAEQWFFISSGLFIAVAGAVMPVRYAMSERVRATLRLSGTPWWFGLILVPVGGLFALCGVIDQSWPGIIALALVFGANWLGRRIRRRDAIDPPPMMVRMDEVPLNPFWGLRHPRRWGRWWADVFKVRRNQREFREWQDRHGLRRNDSDRRAAE